MIKESTTGLSRKDQATDHAAYALIALSLPIATFCINRAGDWIPSLTIDVACYLTGFALLLLFVFQLFKIRRLKRLV